MVLDYKMLAGYIMGKRGTSEEVPFGPETKVYKVLGKIFVMMAWQETPLTITVKCDPDDALAWRARYVTVRPGYYMNKQHWNTITLDGSIPDEEIIVMVDDSYHLVVDGLKKSDRDRLKTAD
jgi:predicted DNA-binding protein (MmcQ/YjbR family)